MVASTVTKISNLREWSAQVEKDWASYKQQADELALQNSYEELLAISLLPLAKMSADDRQVLFQELVADARLKAVGEHLKRQEADKAELTPSDVAALVKFLNEKATYNAADEESINWFILVIGALIGAQKQGSKGLKFSKDILNYLRQHTWHPSGIRVQAEMINAGQNVIFAGRDVNIVEKFYEGSATALKVYLGDVRAEWNNPDLGSIIPSTNRQVSHLLRLHRLYTPLDVWSDEAYAQNEDPKVADLRLRAIEQDLSHLRISAIEAVAVHPRVVIIGSPGTGKSTLARFIAVCLAYACDPDAESHDEVSGLEMLGPAWIHGPLLPIYVNLRNFSADKSIFPAQLRDASAQKLIDFLKKKYGEFADELFRYLTNAKVPVHGTMLLLDGLDEVYEAQDRKIVKKIIENWANRFPKCRILVTSRTYAYKRNVAWRLSDAFKVAEIAPYTWKQIQTYVQNWYHQAALLRPNNFGGREVAEARTDLQAKDLGKTILDSKGLWALARQPLLLTLITLIHEDGGRLPHIRAQLYERTVELLHKWNVPQEGDRLAEMMSGLNFERVRSALQLAAFDLQKSHADYQKPAHIQRSDMLDRLMEQQKIQPGLGAPIENVLEYLATRNGILVTGHDTTYRFLHLSIQEYLAACALIQQYDECKMPAALPSPPDGVWTFPENVKALLIKDPYRWREVAMFIGSILATDKNQQSRWTLIETLLAADPDKKGKLSEGRVHGIYVAAEIWADSFLKARMTTHNVVKGQLIKLLEHVTLDDRLDAPERARAVTILGQLQMDT